MSQTAIATPPAPAWTDLPLEQRLYLASPFGTLLTTAIVFVVLFGSFQLIASIEHVPTFLTRPQTFSFGDASWPAFVLCLLCAAALGMQRYGRVAEARDKDAYAQILSGGMESATAVTSIAAKGLKLTVPTVIGLILGVVLTIFIRVNEFREGHFIPPGTMTWFGVSTTLLMLLFARGLEQTRAGSRAYVQTLDAQLKIDLLRPEKLAVLGRSAARSALIWLTISAVACLFFVGGDLNWLTVALIAFCAAIGLVVFISTMSRIHHKIKDVKDAELEHIRCQIETLRTGLHSDAGAAARIHGLLAYEKRMEDAPEWPFDQPTLVRIAAYILIPTIPWFGQAVVGYAVDHLAH